MASEEWDLGPHRISECPSCGNTTPQRELAWASCEEHAWGEGQDDSPEYFGEYGAYYHFTQCATCGQPAVYAGVEDYDVTTATLAWPTREPLPEVPPAQRHLAAAAELLTDRSQTQVATLLLECVGITYRFMDVGFRGEDSVQIVLAVLLVPPHYVDHFDGELLSEVASALTEAGLADGIIVKDATVAPTAPDGNWRERVERSLDLGPTNQAALLPRRNDLPRTDKLTFASTEEQRVYQVVKEVQATRDRNHHGRSQPGHPGPREHANARHVGGVPRSGRHHRDRRPPSPWPVRERPLTRRAVPRRGRC
jgi:hypothetical protein